MKILKAYLLLLITIILSSCQELKTTTPQEPIWGKEACARCRMVLSEKRYAVQRILENGEVHFYDDLNCALKHDHKNDPGKLYVRPYGSEAWVPAQEALYQDGLRTPMNSGHGAVVEGGSITFEEVERRFKD